MSKLNIYFLYIIALIPWTEYAIPSSENAWCVDCTDQTYPCEIKHSGYHCMGGGRPAVDIFEDAIDFLPAITSDLDACIPSSLNITDDDFQICCIWSPELGCQLIVLKDSYLSFPCSICQGIESEILKSCPCSGAGKLKCNFTLLLMSGIKILHRFGVLNPTILRSPYLKLLGFKALRRWR